MDAAAVRMRTVALGFFEVVVAGTRLGVAWRVRLGRTKPTQGRMDALTARAVRLGSIDTNAVITPRGAAHGARRGRISTFMGLR
eukprot:2492896-Rhodomonas_salina.1